MWGWGFLNAEYSCFLNIYTMNGLTQNEARILDYLLQEFLNYSEIDYCMIDGMLANASFHVEDFNHYSNLRLLVFSNLVTLRPTSDSQYLVFPSKEHIGEFLKEGGFSQKWRIRARI